MRTRRKVLNFQKETEKKEKYGEGTCSQGNPSHHNSLEYKYEMENVHTIRDNDTRTAKAGVWGQAAL